jgi:flagellar biosynthesis protein FliQ
MPNAQIIAAIGREALLLVLITSAPPLLVALLVGLFTGVAQAATQVQEQSLSLVPKIACSLGALILCAPWIAAQVSRFARVCLELIPRVSL